MNMGQYFSSWCCKYISQSVAVYTGYIVTEYEGNVNMGQYYS